MKTPRRHDRGDVLLEYALLMVFIIVPVVCGSKVLYNAGGGNARKWMKNGGDRLALDRWIEAIKFEETCGYVQRVSANLEIYRKLYGKEAEDKNKGKKAE